MLFILDAVTHWPVMVNLLYRSDSDTVGWVQSQYNKTRLIIAYCDATRLPQLSPLMTMQTSVTQQTLAFCKAGTFHIFAGVFP